MSLWLSRKPALIGLSAFAAALVATAVLAFVRVDRALQVATGLSAQTLCSAVFVSGQDARQIFDETLRPMIGPAILTDQLRYTVDTQRGEVRTAWAGIFRSRSVYRGAAGCQLIGWDAVRNPPPHLSSLPGAMSRNDILTLRPAAAINRSLGQVLEQAFVEPAAGPLRRLKAIVVVKNGEIIGERYAPGISPQTPLMGYSMTKTVINALIGILVQQGKLRVSDLAPVEAWRGAGDPRGKITIDQLLRMSSGLNAEESHSGFDATSRMLFAEKDMARFAEQSQLRYAPGCVWQYQSPNTLILSRIVENAVGGREQDVLNFVRAELFWKLGMQTAILETDETGTPVGSQGMLASARDWARLGQLYLDDGLVRGARLLPERWVAYSTSPTLGSTYGAGLWTNRSGDQSPQARITRAGMPSDAFYASGNLGQRIYILPAQHLVIVRLGVTHMVGNGLSDDMRLLGQILSATATERFRAKT